ncbi:MAG: tRNA1(Val) (adenine(37)-N6)-methyltransferase [Lachnospirales bacterium]
MEDILKKANLGENEALDDLQLKGLHLIQNKKLFCFGVDSSLLTDVVSAKKDDRVLDLCTGNGIIPILLSGKTPCKNYIGVEIQEESVSLAKRNVALNNLEKNIKIFNDDIKTFTLDKEVSVVTCNPPYMFNTGAKNQSEALTIARHEVLCSLSDVIDCVNRNLKYGGKFYMVHRADRLVDIMYLLRCKKIEPKILHLIKPYKDRPPNLVIVEALKGGKQGLITKEITIER